jgi:hypothetical protein
MSAVSASRSSPCRLIRAGQWPRPLAGWGADLYRDFIVAASKCYGDALVTSEPQIPDLVGLYAMTSRMRVLSTSRIIARGDNIMLTIVDAYSAPNKSGQEVRELIKQGTGIDLLKEFSEVAREEMHLFKVV